MKPVSQPNLRLRRATGGKVRSMIPTLWLTGSVGKDASLNKDFFRYLVSVSFGTETLELCMQGIFQYMRRTFYPDMTASGNISTPWYGMARNTLCRVEVAYYPRMTRLSRCFVQCLPGRIIDSRYKWGDVLDASLATTPSVDNHSPPQSATSAAALLNTPDYLLRIRALSIIPGDPSNRGVTKGKIKKKKTGLRLRRRHTGKNQSNP